MTTNKLPNHKKSIISTLVEQLKIARDRADTAEAKLFKVELELSELKGKLKNHDADVTDALTYLTQQGISIELPLPTKVKIPSVIPETIHISEITKEHHHIQLHSNDYLFSDIKGLDTNHVCSTAEATALLQIPNGVLKSISEHECTLKKPTIKAITSFYTCNTHAGSKQTNVTTKKDLAVLYSTHVEKLFGITHSKLLSLTKEGFPHIRLNHNNIVFFWGDVVAYAQKNSMPMKAIAIPHLFYKALYEAAAGDYSFTWVENRCVPALAKKGDTTEDEWDAAHHALFTLEPTLKEFMISRDSKILGPLKVRSWLKQHKPDMISFMLDHGNIKYLVKYGRYEKDGNSLIV